MNCSTTSLPNAKFLDSSEELEISSVSSWGDAIQFKLPATSHRLCKSENNSTCDSTSEISLDISRSENVHYRRRIRRKWKGPLPPLGIFWDIENCNVPRNKSAASLVYRIREMFMKDYREAEFVVVCDVTKENPQVIQDLHNTQVNVIHVASISKNAADEKLRQFLRRFGELFLPPAAVLLISSDINFAADLCDIRYRRKLRVILIHSRDISDALRLCANETHNYCDIIQDLPQSKQCMIDGGGTDITVCNLPSHLNKKKIKNRLKMLVDNCGGRVMNIECDEGIATIRFSSVEVATRAQRRIQGEDVFGSKIKVLNPSSTNQQGTSRSYTGRKLKGATSVEPNYQQLPLVQSDVRSLLANPWKSVPEISNQVVEFPHQLCQQRDKLSDSGWSSRRNSFTERRPLTPQDGAIGKDDTKVRNDSHSVLFISNLEPSMSIPQLRKTLMNMLKEYAMVVSLNILLHPDGSPYATVKVSSQQEAQYVISQLHRQKLGNKRLVISNMQNDSPDPVQLRAMIISQLQDAPGKCMPLFKLLELLETRYQTKLSLSEINKLKDICKITEDSNERIVSLTPEVRNSPSPNITKAITPYCSVHCSDGIKNRGWGEPETVQTPNIMMSLQAFSLKVNDLLTSHMGAIPLLSFKICYEMEFGEELPVDDNGVPLEHFLTCVKNVQLKCGGVNKNIKYITREIKIGDSNEEENVLKNVPSALVANINLFCREVIDLLKTTERCQMSWNRFVPAYHHHFGRQCRVAEYGYTKLQDLLEAIPHVLQLMGEADRRIITLSHQAQMKRFTTDLLRVLKNQHSKQISIENFPVAYERTLNKPFNAMEYGLCYLEDLLGEIPSNAFVITRSNNVVTIGIPKREQTPEEVLRTRHFAEEVVRLLRHTPKCSMLFNKFVPSYHHHFGYQCRVSDFGFTKLIELFEAISDVVKIEELPNGERQVSLTIPYALKVLGMQISDLISASPFACIPLEALPAAYMREFGYPLRPEAFECNTIEEVLNKIPNVIEMNHSSAGTLLVRANFEKQYEFSFKVWAILKEPPYKMNISNFLRNYQAKYNVCAKVQNLEKLKGIVEISNRTSDTILSLTPVYVLISELYAVLYDCGGRILYNHLDYIYKKTFSKKLDVSHLEYSCITELIYNFHSFFILKGNKRKYLVLNKHLSEYFVPLPKEMLNKSDTQYNESSVEEEQVWCPPPPAHDLVPNGNRKKVVPPKPDTPPTAESCSWESWSTPTKVESNENLSILLPKMQTPKFSLATASLAALTPSSYLYQTHFGQMDQAAVPMICAPEPGQLPHPDKLLENSGRRDDSHDSGVINNDSEIDGWKF